MKNIEKVIGIHLGGIKDKKSNCGLFISPIIPLLKKDKYFIDKLKLNLNNTGISFKEFKEIEINLILDIVKMPINYFGKKFIENNVDKIDLYINDIKQKLRDTCELKERKNNIIKIKITKKITDLSYICLVIAIH